MTVDLSLQTPAATSGVAIVTDSTTYMPAELMAARGIHQVSLYVGWEGDLRPEHEYRDLDDFYARLRDSPQLPTTSQPSVGDFLAVYRPLVSAGRDVLSIHIAEGLSGTCDSARKAVEVLLAEGQPGKVHVHDGQTGAGGLGCLVLAAADPGGAGARAGEAGGGGACDASDIGHLVRASAALEYLRRGGWIGAARQWSVRR